MVTGVRPAAFLALPGLRVVTVGLSGGTQGSRGVLAKGRGYMTIYHNIPPVAAGVGAKAYSILKHYQLLSTYLYLLFLW